MTDLHTHILPGIDDGAQTVEESIALLRAELDGGVKTVALTPHFRLNSTEQSNFVERRGHAYDLLNDAVQKQALPIRLILGAEVAFSPDLLQLDLDSLCYENTKTLLIELPMDYYPSFARDVFYKLLLKGYTPLIAHVERYPYFASDPSLLEDLVNGGALAQVNAGWLLRDRKTRKRILRMIKDGIVHVLATDAHSMDKRPPILDKAVKVIAKKLGEDTVRGLVRGA
jgi:protein-tyrosine phosphatase